MDIKIKLGIITFFIILIQSGLKLLGVILTGSLSFLSETVDTLTDIFFIILTIYSLYISQKPPDYQHMYGHSKIDSIGGLIQGIILINLYCFLIYLAAQTILSNTYAIINPDIGVFLLIISFIINLAFSRVLIWQGKKRSSLSLKIQGLNLFQDSLRAIVVLINFILALFFNIQFLDPFFSIGLSTWIIFTAFKLSKEGIKDLIDENPINYLILKEIREKVFNLDHVNGVEELKVRIGGNTLFLDVRLSVEDHISVIHANDITKAIRSMSKNYFPSYKVESIIEMNPLSGEASISETIVNLLYTMKMEFKDIIDFRDLNVFRIENNYFLSISVLVDGNLTLDEAHSVSSNFEKELKKQAPMISRIITHIESETNIKKITPSQFTCQSIEPNELKEIQKIIEKILRKNPKIKGYHGLECWSAFEFCILELHVFFEGSENITKIHGMITRLESEIRDNMNLENLKEIILHSEPVEGRTEGIFFE